MAVKYAHLRRIENDRVLEDASDREFMQQLRYALLLGLREIGTISAVQFRHAEEVLHRQRRDRAMKRIKEQEK